VVHSINTTEVNRVRTILVLGYWVLGNIRRYWIVLLLGDILWLLWHLIQYLSDSSRHCPHDNHLDICGAAVVSRRQQGEWGGCRVQAMHRYHHRHTVLRFYMVQCWLYFISDQYIAMLHTGIGIGTGYWYR